MNQWSVPLNTRQVPVFSARAGSIRIAEASLIGSFPYIEDYWFSPRLLRPLHAEYAPASGAESDGGPGSILSLRDQRSKLGLRSHRRQQRIAPRGAATRLSSGLGVSILEVYLEFGSIRSKDRRHYDPSQLVMCYLRKKRQQETFPDFWFRFAVRSRRETGAVLAK
ncbi:hypothetical protein N657DRAFT_671083, partial [Parathielavia appendiculata]